MSDASGFLTISKAAARLDCSVESVRRLFDEGILEGIRTGPAGYRRVSVESIAAYNADLTVSQAARELGLCTATVRAYFDAGLLAGTRTSAGHRRITRRSIETLRAQQVTVS